VSCRVLYLVANMSMIVCTNWLATCARAQGPCFFASLAAAAGALTQHELRVQDGSLGLLWCAVMV
jgi:uncharacterized protein YfiM (DUF2279 family)